jgi:basic amino acid/polyamine antiporter, APA family
LLVAAFHYNGATISAQIAAIGELSTLPLVVLVSLLAQPRVFYMMALDGLLPPVFKEVEGRTEEEPDGN